MVKALEAADLWVVDPSLFTLPYDHELCRALTGAGHRVRLIGRRLRPLERTVSSPVYHLETRFYGASEGGPLRVLPEPIRRLVKGIEHVSGMRRLAAQVRKQKPDVVHFQWLPLPLVDRRFIAAMAGSCSLVLTVHDATAVAGRGFTGVQGRGWVGALQYFHRLVVHTEEGRETLLERGVDRRCVAVIPHPPLPLPETRPEGDGVPSTLMLFGEIKPYKGVDVAIEALALLPETVRLVVAGRPRMPIGPLKKLARDRGVEGRIEWIDRYIPLEELPELLCSASIFLLPYREADASGVLSQILQLGRPIVASRTGVFQQLVAGAGCGTVVEPENAGELADAISSILGDQAAASEMGDNARRLSISMPSWKTLTEQLEGVYAQALSDFRPANYGE